MERLLSITSSPHNRSATTTQTVMRDVLIALCPALIASVVIFGLRSLAVVAVCVATAVLSEYFYRRLMHLSNTVTDLSAAVTGLLLAFNLPVGIPLWQAMIGSFAAIVVIKQLFGGIGKNFANPAIVGRIVLLISFATPMTTWAFPKGFATDAISGPTPLASMSAPYIDLLLGSIGGSLGETCKIALLLGGIYLMVRKVITPVIPLAFLGTVAVLAAILGQDPLFHLLSGGLCLGAFFMATDYVTSPTTEKGKLIFGIGCGVITVVIRLFANYPEGVSFAILLMNIATPLIDRYTAIKPFGALAKEGKTNG